MQGGNIMRLGLGKPSFFRNPHKVSFFLRFSLGLLLSAFLLGVFFARLYPNYLAYLKMYATNTATQLLNESFLEESDCFQNALQILKKNTGEISAVESNPAALNQIRARLVQRMSQKLSENTDGTLRIPFGNLFKNETLSGIGPKIPIRIVPSGIVRADFRQEFTSAGINQVKHSIYLDAEITVAVISAGITRSETVSISIPAAETVIVGEVPSYYAQNASLPILDSTLKN